MNAGALPARPLQVALNPRGLLLVQHKDEDAVLPVAVVFLDRHADRKKNEYHIYIYIYKST